jgi:hypothetical protein
MPIYKCSNGRYRIGTGGCVFETKEKAEKAYKAILAQGKLAAQKVSLDYDGVLSTTRGKLLLKKLLSEGTDVYVISARSEEMNVEGVPASRIYATSSNKAKIEKIKELGIETHYDDNPDVVNELKKLNIKSIKW